MKCICCQIHPTGAIAPPICHPHPRSLGSFSQIKILRAFRIVRLFKRVKSLNQILIALLHSIPGVINAMIVLAIFMFIYAIIAVDLFRDFGAEGDYDTLQTFGPGGPDAQWGPGVIWGTTPPSTQARFERRTKVSAMTPRGFHFGQEYYGTFSRSLYTLFQVRRVRSPSPATQLP